MPKRKSVPSLQRLCLDSVARNMRRLWVKDRRINGLAGSILQELLQLMGKKMLLTSTLLCSLLLPQVKELNLTCCSSVMSPAVAHVITARCKNLTTLILCNCNHILPEELTDLIKGLPQLVKLDLSNTQCDTYVLSTVGTCCQKLCKLDIRKCRRVSSDSLFHLAYDPITHSFLCQALEALVLGPLKSRTNSLDFTRALVFLLLALPKLKFLVHDFVIQAVILIHKGTFEGAWMPAGFPSLEEVVRCRMPADPNEGRSRLTLALEEIHFVCDSSLPVVSAMCPHLSKVSVIFTNNPDMGQNFWSECRITKLTLNCLGRRDMRGLLPMIARLRAQLVSLSISGFYFEDKSSFQALLDHCVNLRKLSIRLLSPEVHHSSRHANTEGPACDFSHTPREFPHLSGFSLLYSANRNPLPSRHIILLKQCLESLLKYSPRLEKLELAFLPFSLDDIFEKVLNPAATALLSLHKLSLVAVQVSIRTMHQLLSSENQLSCISMYSVSSISGHDYQNLHQRVIAEGLDLDIQWKL